MGALMCSSTAIYAQNFQTMAIQSGLNHDVIANGVGSANISTSIDVDGVSYAFVSRDFQLTASSTPLTYGLPANGLISSAVSSTPGLNYQLANYSGNNSLRLAAQNDTGTIAFTTPVAATKLYMLSTSGSGTSTVTAVVNFTDGTSQTFAGLSLSDWYGGSNFAIQGIGRINRNTNTLEPNSNDPRLYQTLLTIDASNQTKLIQSVAVTKTAGAGLPNVFAFSADAYSTCLAPTLQAPTAITSNSANVSWTGVSSAGISYDVYYSTTNTTPASTVTPQYPAVAGTSQTLGSLASNTNYYYWVRTNCSGSTSQSSWSFVGTFKTACGAMTSMFENFDSYGTGNIVPDCWVRNAGTGSTTITTTSPASGTRNIYQYAATGATPSTIVLPEFSNIAAGTNWLRLKARVSSATGTLKVGYVTNPTDASTFTLIQNLSLSNTSYTNSEYTVVVPSTVPANARLAIQNAVDGRSYYWDDVYWEAIPTCIKPTNVTTSAPTTSGFTVSWVAPTPAPANGYEVYYSTSNVAPTSTTVLNATNSVTSTTTTAPITGLQADTNYYIWVRSNCSATDKSAWSDYVASIRTGYCVPSSGNQNSWVSIFNSTGATTNMAYSSSTGGSGGYQNLTTTANKIANTAGSSTNIAVTVGGPTCGISIWVDWNKNFVFESSEKVYGTTSYQTSITGAIAVPAGTPPDIYRMRIGVDYNNSTPNDPCVATTRGEFIDFNFEVTGPSMATNEVSGVKKDLLIHPNPFSDVLNIADVSKVKSISVMDLSGKVVKSFEKPEASLRMSDLSSGMYLVVLNMLDGTKQTIKAIKK